MLIYRTEESDCRIRHIIAQREEINRFSQEEKFIR
jgi:hypothetical protein